MIAATAVALALAASRLPDADAAPGLFKAATVIAPRAYGYTVGDLLPRRVALGTAAAPFFLAELPRIGRIGNSLWLRRSEEIVDPGGQHWLVMEYQLINTPQVLSVWYLPSLTLKAKAGPAVLTVAATPFSVGPFTPSEPFGNTALPAMQPDEAPASVALAPIEKRILGAGGALAAVILGWALIFGWRYFRRGRHLPFARAVRDMQAQAMEPLACQRRLHHALNDAAGEVVRPASLGCLLARAPYLAAEREALEQFLRESRAVFFGGQASAGAGLTSMVALARRLRRLEQRFAR